MNNSENNYFRLKYLSWLIKSIDIQLDEIESESEVVSNKGKQNKQRFYPLTVISKL